MFGLKKWFLGGMLIAAITSLPLFAAHAMNKVYFSSETFEQNEDGGTATIIIVRVPEGTLTEKAESLAKKVTVEFATSDGTATAGSDYTEYTTTVVFEAWIPIQIVTIPIINDNDYEEDEIVNLALSNPTEEDLENPDVLGSPSTAKLTIIEDETKATCGNSVVELTEQCDFGPSVEGDCCTDDDCQFEAAGFSCDDQSTCSPTDQCDDAGLCTGSGSTCGDGNLDDASCGEGCDDGNMDNGDGCNSTCQIEFCGDQIINNTNEQCDDGNTKDNDGCSPTCKIEICGDGVVNNNGDELCDDANAAGGDGCSATCQVEFCGDGSVNNNGTEQCDDGNLTDEDGCDKNCVQEAAAEEAPVEEIPAGDITPDESSPAGGGCSLIRR
ncbi:MAG: DUF4215 domain-containing protein [bacterium]